MTSVAEVRAAISAVTQGIEEMRGAIGQAQEVATGLAASAAAVVDGSGQENAAAIVSRLRSAEMNLDDALANLGVAIDLAEQVNGSL